MLELRGSKKALIIHHWDADGLCSAALLSEYLTGSQVKTWVPQIGTYHLSREILKLAESSWDSILIADINLPASELVQLGEVSGSSLFIFDHHLTDLPNPQPNGYFHPSMVGIDVENYPSTTWLITKLLNLPVSILSVLGAVGDKGPSILADGPVGAEIRNFMTQTGLTTEQITRILELLESNYKLGETELVQSVVAELLQSRDDPSRLLTNKTWLKNLDRLESEIEAQSKVPILHRADGIHLQTINSRCDIASALGRKLAWNGGCEVAVVLNTGFLKDHDQLYIRQGTKPIDSSQLIKTAHARGYSAGGKREVVGIVVPKQETDVFLSQMMDQLANMAALAD